jgi:hypothetical protein
LNLKLKQKLQNSSSEAQGSTNMPYCLSICTTKHVCVD